MAPAFLSNLTIVQVAIVVTDLEASAARHAMLTGGGRWRVYDFGLHRIRKYTMRGQPATGRTLLALNDARPQVELLQPMAGTSAHQEWLDEHSESMHHVGAVVDSVDDTVAAAAAVGIGVISSGEGFGADGSGKFAYLDTQSALGMIVEVLEPPTSLGEPDRRL